jgi:hypothetical protein
VIRLFTVVRSMYVPAIGEWECIPIRKDSTLGDESSADRKPAILSRAISDSTVTRRAPRKQVDKGQ